MLNETKIRSRVKSNAFSRFANLLPRNRDESCCRCLSQKESSNHVLLECESLRKEAAMTIKILKTFFSITIEIDSFLTLLQKDMRTRVLQMTSLYCSWRVRCSVKYEEKKSQTFWQSLLTSEIRRYILKNSSNSEDWSPLILSFDPPSLSLSLVPLFQHHED